MEFINNISKEEYIAFYNSCPNAHFLQSYAWGQISEHTRNLIPCYVGLKNNNKLICATLLLKKATPFNMCYFYAPRGYLIDYKDLELLDTFTKYLKVYLKTQNGIYLKVDPEIKYQTIDSNANKIEGENNYPLFEHMKKIGYIHKGFNKLYERNQPRYTFRIPLTSKEEIMSRIAPGVAKQIKRSEQYDMEIIEANDISNFMRLNKLISDKDGFIQYSYEFYENLYKEFNKTNDIKIYEARIKPKYLYETRTKELENIEKDLKNGNISSKKIADTESKINRLKKELELLKDYSYLEELVIASLICIYTSNIMWTMYIGNDTLGYELFAVSRLYYESFIKSLERKCQYADLFGVVGDPFTNHLNLKGIYKYKANFGGEYIEFLGEFDLVNKKIWYKILPSLLSCYRKIRGHK